MIAQEKLSYILSLTKNSLFLIVKKRFFPKIGVLGESIFLTSLTDFLSKENLPMG